MPSTGFLIALAVATALVIYSGTCRLIEWVAEQMPNPLNPLSLLLRLILPIFAVITYGIVRFLEVFYFIIVCNVDEELLPGLAGVVLVAAPLAAWRWISSEGLADRETIVDVHPATSETVIRLRAGLDDRQQEIDLLPSTLAVRQPDWRHDAEARRAREDRQAYDRAHRARVEAPSAAHLQAAAPTTPTPAATDNAAADKAQASAAAASATQSTAASEDATLQQAQLAQLREEVQGLRDWQAQALVEGRALMQYQESAAEAGAKLQSDNARLAREIEEEKERFRLATGQATGLSQTRETLEANLDAAHRARQALQEKNDKTVAAHKEEVRRLETRRAELQQHNVQLDSANHQLQQQLAEARQSEPTNSADEVRQLREHVDSVTCQRDELSRTEGQLRSEVKELHHQVQLAEQRYGELASSMPEAERKYTELQQGLDALQQEYDRFRAEAYATAEKEKKEKEVAVARAQKFAEADLRAITLQKHLKVAEEKIRRLESELAHKVLDYNNEKEGLTAALAELSTRPAELQRLLEHNDLLSRQLADANSAGVDGLPLQCHHACTERCPRHCPDRSAKPVPRARGESPPPPPRGPNGERILAKPASRRKPAAPAASDAPASHSATVPSGPGGNSTNTLDSPMNPSNGSATERAASYRERLYSEREVQRTIDEMFPKSTAEEEDDLYNVSGDEAMEAPPPPPRRVAGSGARTAPIARMVAGPSLSAAPATPSPRQLSPRELFMAGNNLPTPTRMPSHPPPPGQSTPSTLAAPPSTQPTPPGVLNLMNRIRMQNRGATVEEAMQHAWRLYQEDQAKGDKKG